MGLIDNHLPLHYDEDARSVHTLLRVINPDDHEDTCEVVFDNLTTPMKFIQMFDWRIRQEFLGFAATPSAEDLTDENATQGQALAAAALGGWREHVSGPGDDALVIEAYGKPKVLRDFIQE